MQLGGNSNALQFFSQHNCTTTDVQKKYNSRAAQLYKDKLNQAAIASVKSNPHLHITSSHENHDKSNANNATLDIFAEHEQLASKEVPVEEDFTPKITKKEMMNLEDGPKVDCLNSELNSASAPKTSNITARKQPAKKGLGGVKKSGLGATKVKANFAELEREAELAEESRMVAAEESLKSVARSAQERSDQEAAVKLAYKDISEQQHKQEERLRKQDPKKADQFERLGMGVMSKSGISHSALSDMQTIEQENLPSAPSTLSSLGKLRLTDTESFFDDHGFGSGGLSSGFGGFGSGSSSGGGGGGGGVSKIEAYLAEAKSNSKDSWVIIDDPPEKPKSKSTERPVRTLIDSSTSSDEARKKFGNAKAISSDQYFGDKGDDYETKANLSRFQGSSSISSAEFFGNDREVQPTSSLSNYDIEDVKESVRQGVTKVAGKLGSLANGLMSSIQDRYGY
ncbi:unnamed protein product [Acanthoscelides obtectus]|nr:unnamed protein product [Acanthoscelides obtectus]CAK1644122.1 ADP-ribosylation factor GTPase-activating protein 2 [Acanthoscelides obtectus]